MSDVKRWPGFFEQELGSVRRGADVVLASDYDALKARLADEAARLDYLITWLGLNDDVQQLPVRDWYDNEDARSAIDEARAADSASVGRECQTLAALDSEDAARFRWLCDDHADKAARHLRDSLLERMSMMSLSAVRAAIGTHLINMSEQAKSKDSHHE